MAYDLDKGAHSVYSLYYHFIQVVKYRKKVFTNDAIVDFLKMKTREIADTFTVVFHNTGRSRAYVTEMFRMRKHKA